MAGQSEFEELSAALQKSLLASSRLAGQLPAAGELRYQRTLSRPLGKKVDEASKRLLHITSRVLEVAKQAPTSKDKGKKVVKEFTELEEEDLVDGYQRRIVEVTDQLLEQIDTNLDEYSNGAKGKAKALDTSAGGPFASTSNLANGRSYSNFRNAGDIRKPQLDFANPLETRRNATFLPALPTKPHSLVPLNMTPTSFVDPDTGEDRLRIPNPYAVEIEAVVEKPLPDLDNPYTITEGDKMESQMATKPFTYVDTSENLSECLSILQQAKVIAIDLEHHEQRTYRGITCLMQCSTLSHDFIIDPLVPVLRSELHSLNEVFANPNVVKVLHGAESDIIWLQRDFGLYLVNLFDTFHASQELGRLTGHSLASLLKEYTTFMPEKKYQLADWRIRPLTPALIQYARSDTHFLIYIFFAILNHPSMTPDMLQSIRVKSARTASQTYEHAIYDYEEGYGAGGWRKMLERSGKLQIWGVVPYAEGESAGESKPWQWVDKQGKTKFEVFRDLHDWRDRAAREADESAGYVLNNKSLFAVAEALPLNLSALESAVGKDFSRLAQSTRTAVIEIVEAAFKKESSMSVDQSRSSTQGSDLPPAPSKKAAQAAPLFSSRAMQPTKDLVAPSSFISRTSIFFGDVGQRKSELAGMQNKQFVAAMQKVHQDLLGQMQPVSAKTFDNSPSHQLSAQRDTKVEAVSSPQTQEVPEDSEIVSVKGRAKGNKGQKRKSSPSQDTTMEHVAAIPQKKGKLPFVKPFDYTGVKSVLDTPIKTEVDSPKNKRPRKNQSGGDKVQDSTGPSFKKPPKPMNQPKHGNKSHTFL